MTAKERLEKAQNTLKAQGVQDVKFFLGEKASSASLEKLKEAAASVIEGILGGKAKVKKVFGHHK